MTPSAEPLQIRCAEVWGGISAKEDEIATPGVKAAIHSSAAGGTRGGDLYYFSVCAYDTLTRLAIADVRGHGPAVAQISEWLYESLQHRMNDSDGSRVLTDLNDIVRQRGFEAITTAAVATFHRDRGQLHFAYAGHPPLFLGRADGSWMELETPTQGSGPTNLPLGMFAGARFVQEKVKVAPGDRLFAYTDGVPECPAPGATDDPELFGDSRMLAALRRSATQPLFEARRYMHDELTGHAGGPLTHDDCTFLLVEVLKPPPYWKRRILPGKPRVLSMQ